MLNPINVYSGGGLRPVMDSAGELTDAVNLAPGKQYAEGLVIGQVLGTGAAVNEVQTMTPTAVTAGTFTLTVDGQTTAPIAFNASNATIQAALEALSNVGTGGIVVGGGPVNTTPTTFTFSNQCGGGRQPLIVPNNSGLTGTFAVAETTPGKPAGGYWDAYLDSSTGAFAGLATAKRLLTYATRVDVQGRHFGGTDPNAADNNSFLRHASAYIAGTFSTAALVGLDANGCTDLGRIIAGDVSSLAAPTTLIRLQ